MADGAGGGSYSAYGWGQGLSDMLGGYLSESDKIRQENEKKNQQQLEIENAALQHLMTADDPRVKAAAMTAWLSPRKYGPGPLAKWYGQQESNPAFSQVQTILGQGTPGMNPWLSPAEKIGTEYEQGTRGRARGIFGAYREFTHQEPPQPFVERTLAGMSGAPQRAMPLQRVNLILKDGSTIAGHYDPSDGAYYDENYQYRDDVVRSTPQDPNRTTAGDFIWRQRADGKYDVLHKSDPTKVIGTTDQAYTMPAGSYQTFQTPGGIVTVRPGPGQGSQYIPFPTGADIGVTSPQQNYEDLDRMDNRIVAYAYRRATSGIIPTYKPQVYQNALDELAREQSNGMYKTYADLQADKEQWRQQMIGIQRPAAPTGPGRGGAPTEAAPGAPAQGGPPKGIPPKGRGRAGAQATPQPTAQPTVDVNLLLENAKRAQQGQPLVPGGRGQPAGRGQQPQP